MKEVKKLKLNKTTIANLNNSEMYRLRGGENTIPRHVCDYTATICGASDYNPTCNCVTNDNPCV